LSNLIDEFKIINTNLTKFLEEIPNSNLKDNLKIKFTTLLENFNDKNEQLKSKFEEIKGNEKKLIDYYCEDLVTFNIDKFFKIFYTFFNDIQQVRKVSLK
jgi:adenylate kinase family enzyme